MTDTIKLNDGDWDEIFKVELFTIGTTNIPLKPLVLEELAEVSVIISQASDIIIKNMPDFNKSDLSIAGKIGESLPMVAGIISREFPEALHKMSKLDIDDIKKLPAPIQVDLALKCLDVNLSSMESLSKNFVALIAKIETLSQGLKNIGGKEKPAQ